MNRKTYGKIWMGLLTALALMMVSWGKVFATPQEKNDAQQKILLFLIHFHGYAPYRVTINLS